MLRIYPAELCMHPSAVMTQFTILQPMREKYDMLANLFRLVELETCQLVTNSIHTADVTQLDSCVGIGSVYWVLNFCTCLQVVSSTNEPIVLSSIHYKVLSTYMYLWIVPTRTLLNTDSLTSLPLWIFL